MRVHEKESHAATAANSNVETVETVSDPAIHCHMLRFLTGEVGNKLEEFLVEHSHQTQLPVLVEARAAASEMIASLSADSERSV